MERIETPGYSMTKSQSITVSYSEQSKSVKIFATTLCLLLHSTAGGGLKGAQSGLVQASQEAGMWKLIATNSWPWERCFITLARFFCPG